MQDKDDSEREVPNILKEAHKIKYVLKKNPWKGTIIPRKTDTIETRVDMIPSAGAIKYARLFSIIQRHPSLKRMSAEDRNENKEYLLRNSTQTRDGKAR